MQKIGTVKINGFETYTQESAINIEALFEANWDAICSTIYWITGDWDEAQDLSLETFAELFRHPPGFKTNLPGWLYRVATHKALNFLRDARRRRQYEIRAGRLSLESNSPDNPIEIIMQEQERQDVRRILGKMKFRSAQLLVLRHSGLSYKEIAEALRINPKSIGSLLVRAEAEFLKRYLSRS